MSSFNLQTLIRPNILSLKPYRCARDDFTEGILLDANENSYGPSLTELNEFEQQLDLHRYPDPHQIALKQLICDFRNGEGNPEQSKSLDLPLTPANICLGVGSDESIDALIRTICQPGKDKLLICPPTYGMYTISSQINDIEVVKVPLNLSNFELQPEQIIDKITNDPTIKLIYITTPGNPTGKLIPWLQIKTILETPNWNGIVIADEAYIDFTAIGSSVCTLVNKYPNLVTMQTLSKSFGLASIRLGITYSCVELSTVLNSLKAPYNISSGTAEIAKRAVSKEGVKLMRENCAKLCENRKSLIDSLLKFEEVEGLIGGGQDANFILIKIVDKRTGEADTKLALKIYETMATLKGVVVRFRGMELGCDGGLRITVGNEDENKVLLKQFEEVLNEQK
ncbi:hypothetical protein WICPIJ_005776 [Wickerhamomyces pijperi]|uniref:histidinol-phosphate transaminase n=1 Tax=Wickerhamomyces pijperi TaxID=599730 RepID=A0A9P8Q2X5_WICPI|nr:hypothetical protein WICPIJ_005776 [Wickerhamomyces pijperi]